MKALSKILRVGTRASKLALVQTDIFVKNLKSVYPSIETEIVKIKTYGDINKDNTLSVINDAGAFTKALEDALINNEIDCAVHSSKDLPSALPDELIISCTLKRGNPHDALVYSAKCRLTEIPQNIILGTNSPRRIAQISRIRPDLQFKNIRGNIDTRLRKFDDGEYQGLVVAAAGFERLNLKAQLSYYFSLNECLPAAGQGIISIETRKDDDEFNDLLKNIIHQDSFIALKAERACLKELNAGCNVPLGIYAKVKENKIHIRTRLLNFDGSIMIESEKSAPVYKAEDIGMELAGDLINKGGNALLNG